jgi:hypothetical protein
MPTFPPTENPTKNPTSQPTFAPTTQPPTPNPTTQSPTSCEEDNASLRATVADLEARPACTSQCNAEDGKVAFDQCRCNELAVIEREAEILTKDVCAQVPVVDCVNGFERVTGFACTFACYGQCCTGFDACWNFTGLLHKDGSCNGHQACKDATIDEVKGSCTGRGACGKGKFGLVTDSCNNEVVCYNSEVSLIEGSCNGRASYKDCSYIIATSIIDGAGSQVFLKQTYPY